MVTNDHKEFGLIGRGISHSFSAKYFSEKFAKENIDAEYNLFDLPDISLFPKLIGTHPNLQGLNVTAPFKREVIQFLDSLSPEAESLKAVNVIQFERNDDGSVRLIGHNTDCEGFRVTIEEMPRRFLKAAVLGTGGASSAVRLALKKEGIESILVSRNPKSTLGEISYDDFNSHLGDYDLIVNATPVGMYPKIDTCPAIEYGKLSSEQVCYDLIYNPEETLFLKKAVERGAKTTSGLQMLLNQADLSWQIWSDNR